MHTIRLKISDKIYDKIIWLLSKFNKDEVEVITESPEFSENKKYLEEELREIKEGNTEFLSLEEAEQRLEKVIKKHEGRS